MSAVTDIILIVANDDSDNFKAEFGLQRVDKHAGGDKAMQCDVFMSAMNVLTVEPSDIVAWFHTINLYAPECAQLLIKEEHEDVFSVYVRCT